MKNITLGLLTSVGLLAGAKVDTVDSVLSDEAIKIKRLQDIIDYCEDKHTVLHDDYIESCDKHLAESEALKLKQEADRKELLAKFHRQLDDFNAESDTVVVELNKAKVALARYK